MSKALVILASLLVGLFSGSIFKTGNGALTECADVIGTLWLNSLRMTVVPLVVALLIGGIAQTTAAARAGKLTFRAVLAFMTVLWCSATMAAFVTPALLRAFPIPGAAGAALKQALSSAPAAGEIKPFSEFLRAIVPTNPFEAAASEAILPLIVFTMAFSFATLRLPDVKRKFITGFFEAVGDAMLIVINWVLIIAPVGVFALSHVVGAKAGGAALGALAHYVAIVGATGSVIWISAYFVAVIGARRGPLKFFRAAIPAQAVAISTQSSLVSLPAMLKGLSLLGVPSATSDLVLPVAVAIFRATGPAMNLAVAIYVAHWMGIELTSWVLVAGVVTAATTTVGSVSLPGTVSFVTSIAPIAIAMGVPVDPLALLIAVETFPDIIRTLGNVTMDMALTATISERAVDTLEVRDQP